MLFGNMRHRTETKRHTGNALKLSLHFGRFVLLTAIWVSFITVSSHAANDLTGEAQHTGTPRLSKEHVPPVKSCPDKHGPGPDYKDFSGQVLQEYQNSLIRDVVNHNTFDQCPSYYSDPLTRVTGYCYPPLSKDISQSIKEMIPRMQGSEQQLNNLEAEEEKKGKKRWGKAWEERKKTSPGTYSRASMIEMLGDTFIFEEGIPFDVQAPTTAPPIEEVLCGYCSPETIPPIAIPGGGMTNTNLWRIAMPEEVVFRICLFFRNYELRDLRAERLLSPKSPH